MKKLTIRNVLHILLYLFISGCGSSQNITPTQIPSATITNTATVTATSSPTNTPTVTPTPIGGGSGAIIFTEGSPWGDGALYSIDTDGRNKKLIHENCSSDITFHIIFSPDGRYLTCGVSKQIENGSGKFGIILIDLETHTVSKRLIGSSLIGPGLYYDSRSIRVMGYSPHYNGFINWSPDSKNIAFIGTHEGKTGLFVINIENSSVTLLSESQNLYYPIWSPGSKKIMFFDMLQDSHWSRNHVYVVNIDGTHLVKLTKELAYYSSLLSAWGNDENTVYLNDKYGFRGINLETMKLNDETLPKPDPANVYTPSPNGQYNLVVRNVYEGAYLESQNGSQSIDVKKYFTLFDSTRPHDIQWSPDSNTLAHYNPNEGSIVLLSVNNLELTTLVKVNQSSSNQWADNNIGKFSWLPDGKRIVFVQGNGANGFDICITDLSGNISKITTTVKDFVNLYIEQSEH